MLFVYLSCPATTSFPAILRGKLSNFLYSIQTIKLLLLLLLLKVEGVFYINDLLERLMFDELKHWAGTQGTIK